LSCTTCCLAAVPLRPAGAGGAQECESGEPDTDTPPSTNPTIPITGRDAKRIQAIANTAGFHFALIEQGGASLYPTLAFKATDPTVLRILVSIGGVEVDHFGLWHDKGGNAVSQPLAGVTVASIEKAREAIRNNPNSAGAWDNLAYGYLGSNRPDEAWQTMQQALAKFPESDGIHWFTYVLATTLGKPADADRELACSKGRQLEYRFLGSQNRWLWEQGKLRVTEESTRRMLDMENNQGLTEAAEGDLGFLVCRILNSFTNKQNSAYWQYAPATCTQTVPHGLRSRAVTGD
jgi:hypothetical protein